MSLENDLTARHGCAPHLGDYLRVALRCGFPAYNSNYALPCSEFLLILLRVSGEYPKRINL
jgi:hypothetical protein